MAWKSRKWNKEPNRTKICAQRCYELKRVGQKGQENALCKCSFIAKLPGPVLPTTQLG